jgi:hypothetical protein
MIRTVWLAIACLAALGALALGKTLTGPAAPAGADRPTEIATAVNAPGQETLTKADRLEIAYVRFDSPVQPALRPAEPLTPAPSIAPRAETKIISRHWRDPNAPASSAAKSKQEKQTVANKKSKRGDPKGGQAADRSKAAEQVKPCERPGAFGNFLRSLNLSPACAS